jgi:hypothetical protein
MSDDRCQYTKPQGRYTTQCPKKAKVTRDGRHYCTIHDPEYIKRKREKRNEIYESGLIGQPQHQEKEPKTITPKISVMNTRSKKCGGEDDE